jgi:tetratricopeptide (TPR) repeat protein
MDCAKALDGLSRNELIDLAKKLEIKNPHKFKDREEELKKYILDNYNKDQINALLAPPIPCKETKSKEKRKWLQILFITSAFIGLISFILMLIFQYQSTIKDKKLKETIESLLKKKYGISEMDPTIPDYEKEIEELKGALTDRNFVDIKERNEALQAFKKGELSKAETFFKKLKAKTTYNLGNIYFLQVKYEKSLEAYKNAGRLDPENSEYQNAIGKICQVLGKYSEALDYFKKALDRDIQTYGKEHPKVAIRLNNLGATLYLQKEYKQAIDNFKKALAIDLKLYVEEHPAVARDQNNLGEVWASLKEYQRAISYYKKALNTFKNTLGPDHPFTKIMRENLALVTEILNHAE